MAATMWIEMETGTGFGPEHPHNGYWAGDFSDPHTSEQPDESHTGRGEHAGSRGGMLPGPAVARLGEGR